MTTQPLQWRKAKATSSSGGACVELADTGTGILMRNSNRLGEGTLPFTRKELACFIDGCKAGEFDDLA